MRALVLMVLAPLLAGCGIRPAEKCVAQPYEVAVPYYQERKAPDSLLLPYVPTEIPQFAAPGAPGVIYGLTDEGMKRLQTILRTMQTRDKAWRSWAIGQGEPNAL